MALASSCTSETVIIVNATEESKSDAGGSTDGTSETDGNRAGDAGDDANLNGPSDIDADTGLDADTGAEFDADVPTDAETELDASVPLDAEVGASVCGDSVCDPVAGETCSVCPIDCGSCQPCDFAPLCADSLLVPIEFTPLPEFNNNGQTNYGSGVGMGVPPEETTCSAPRLKIQLSRVVAHKDGLSFGGSGGFKVFCVVEANDGKDMELILTEQMDLEGDGKSFEIEPTSGIFWGLGTSTVKQSQFNLTLNYNCYRDKDGDVWADVLKGISDAAGAGAGIPGNPYGWAFGLGSVAAAAAEAAIQKAGLTNVLSVEQRIAKESLLLLTEGRTWSVRQKGKFDSGLGSEKSDVELVIRAWGCSTPRPLPPQ